jgi:hypothetical protein
MSHNKINIYQMYLENGNKAGFYVKRNSWSTQIAEIVSIDGKTSGELDGSPPYFNNPKVIGRFGRSGKAFEVTCAGTYGYTLIKEENNND